MKCWWLSGGVHLWLAMILSGCLSAIDMQPGWTSVELGSREKAEPILDSKIHQLSEIERPITSAQRRVQSPAPATVPSSEIVQVIGVKANPTEKGVYVILQTTLRQQLQVVNRSAGNNYIADIPNAQLRLPKRMFEKFRGVRFYANRLTMIRIMAR